MENHLRKKLYRIVFIFACLFACINIACGQKTTIYCFPGQGSDERLFGSIRVDTALFVLKVIEYGTPEESMDMKSFAYSLINRIDTMNPYILLGVSLGGMLCVELNERLNPEKTIIVSSAKNRNELPYMYRFQKKVPLYGLLPKEFLYEGAKIMQPLVEPDRNKNKETFKSMLSEKDPTYMERTIALIINWERETNTKKIYQIHGTNDRTLPLRFIRNPDFVVENASHMMTLTHGTEISRILKYILLGGKM
jgi:pimeloyl-ACP methyl ester carboxylesterase